VRTPIHPLHAAAVEVVAQALGIEPDLFEVAPPPSRELGDFGVGCFPAARRLHQPPQALASQVAAGEVVVHFPRAGFLVRPASP